MFLRHVVAHVVVYLLAPVTVASAPGGAWLVQVFGAAESRAAIPDPRTARAAGNEQHAQASNQGRCSFQDTDERPNIFLLWTAHAEQFGQLAYASLESVLFQHPSANVAVVSAGLPLDLFDAYVREGYCVASLPMDMPQANIILTAVVGEELATNFITFVQKPTSDETVLMMLLNCITLALQALYGGISLPMEGLLLNPFDMLLPRQLKLSDAALFLERVLPPDEPPIDSALQTEDFEKSWMPRSYTDRADGRVLVCLQIACPRSIPASSQVGRLILQEWIAASIKNDPQNAFVDVDFVATVVYQLYVRQRPKLTPFTVDGFVFDHEVVLLPYWVTVEPHFPDGYKAFGGHDDIVTKHSQLYVPRRDREPTDWSQLSSSKLWLPLGYGPLSARNIGPRSVVDLALRYFGIGVAPKPYRQKGFGTSTKDPSKRRLTVNNAAFSEFGLDGATADARAEAALPGLIGGFRTFRHLRLVGKDEDSGSPFWRITINDTSNHKPDFFCRREQRPAQADGAEARIGSKAYRACLVGLGNASKNDLGDSHTSQIIFDACATPAELNAAMALLAYNPAAGLGRQPLETDDTDQRLNISELGGHFGSLTVAAFRSCSSVAVAHKVVLSVLHDDVEDQVTVVAHSAERCDLLERLGRSFRDAYTRLPMLVTCECAEEEQCVEPVPNKHPVVEGMTIVKVPYDFGLSRGKTYLARHVLTEFVLVLDDDFVFTFHSCLECMLWRMRSRHHSLWRPFDIVGFPVLEDERMFGAFRGRLRVTGRQLFLEPFHEQVTPDGCMRVDICPMVFLARTSRLRRFKFRESLRVGEHEQFFYSNQYLGMQVAVCFDSSFAHSRVQTATAAYQKRRDRMPQLMQSAFQSLGFERAMFLFQKYDHANMADYDELLLKMVPPWYISDDTCGPRPVPPVPFAQMFAIVFSAPSAEGAQYRRVLRGQTGAPYAWIRRFADAGVGNIRWMFAVPEPTDHSAGAEVRAEQVEHKDVVFVPPGANYDEPTTEQLLHAFSLIRDFQFRWLVVALQNVFVHIDRAIGELQGYDPPGGKVFGRWTSSSTSFSDSPEQNGPHYTIDPQFFVLPRDLFALFSSPQLSSRLSTDGSETGFGTKGRLSGALNSWFRAFAIERVTLPGLHFRGEYQAPGTAFICPSGAVAIHPVSPSQLHALSASPSSSGC